MKTSQDTTARASPCWNAGNKVELVYVDIRRYLFITKVSYHAYFHIYNIYHHHYLILFDHNQVYISYIIYTFEGIFYGPVCTFEGIGNDKTRGQINSGIDLRPRSERRTVWCAMHAPRSARHGVVLHALCRISRSLSLLTRREPSLYLPSARFLFLRAFPLEFETVLSHLAERYKYNRLRYRWRYLYVRFSLCLTSSSVLDLRCEHLSMSGMDYLVFKVDYFKYHHRLARILEKFRVDWRINKQGEQEELTRKCFDPKVGDSLKRIISG